MAKIIRKDFNGEKEEFMFLIAKGKIRSKNQNGRSFNWANKVDLKKKELKADGKWKLVSVTPSKTGHCEFCNHAINRAFEVRSEATEDRPEQVLKIGSECVRYFTSLEAVVEMLLIKTRARNYKMDVNLKVKKLLDFMKKNKEELKNKKVEWTFYNQTSETNHFDVLLDMIRKSKRPQMIERAMNKLGISTKDRWYKFTDKEQDLRQAVKDVDILEGNEIHWKIDDKDIPDYPTYFPGDFS